MKEALRSPKAVSIQRLQEVRNLIDAGQIPELVPHWVGAGFEVRSLTVNKDGPSLSEPVDGEGWVEDEVLSSCAPARLSWVIRELYHHALRPFDLCSLGNHALGDHLVSSFRRFEYQAGVLSRVMKGESGWKEECAWIVWAAGKFIEEITHEDEL